MPDGDPLAQVLARIAASGDRATLIGAQELEEWPPATVAAMKRHRLLLAAPPATSAVCPGCERQCVMPLEVVRHRDRDPRAFVVCDTRDDVNRVDVPARHLEQWRTSLAIVADTVALALQTRRAAVDETETGRCELGVLKGRTNSAHVVLVVKEELQVEVAGHVVDLVDVLAIENGDLAVDRTALVRCVDRPIGKAGDEESAEARGERLLRRRAELRDKGVRNFRNVMAEEEGCSPSRIGQILKDARKRGAKKKRLW